MKMEAQIQMISVGSIIPNRFQPRQEFDQEALNELASSIRIHGIVQPLVVRRVQDKFEIIAGERRFKAATSLGLTAVPCIICALDDNEVAEVAVVENIHRRDLSPIEEARGYQNILDKKYLNQDQLAQRMGIKPNVLNDKLQLLTLDEAVQTALQHKQISEKHAKTLLKLTDKMKQVDLLNEIITNKLSVKQVEEKINQIINGYSVKEDLTGGINVNARTDIDVSESFNTENDFNLSITPTQYQYRSKINENPNKKANPFFNTLEDAPVTMEDPTLSFGFDPMKTQDIEQEEPEIIDLDEDGDELPGFEKQDDEISAEEALRKKFNVDVYTPREFTKAVNDLILIAQDNGLEIKTEEFNFNDVYQMVIKIVKETEEEEETTEEAAPPTVQ